MRPVALLDPEFGLVTEDKNTMTALMAQLADEMAWGGFAAARRLDDRLAARYRAPLGRKDLAEAVASCWATGRGELWPDDRRWQPGASRHRPKLCAIPAHMETRRRLRVMLQRHRATEGLRLTAWNTIRRHRSFRAIRAALASWEVTWSLARGDWHPHLNVLVTADWDDPAPGAGDVNWDRIHREWEAHCATVNPNAKGYPSSCYAGGTAYFDCTACSFTIGDTCGIGFANPC